MSGESTGFDLAGEIWRLTRRMLKRKESEMGITEDLREKARRLGGKRGFSCSKYLADEFGIECGEVSCGECYACLFERIADRIEAETDEPRDMVREPQLPEGVEWPRFEDGELVKIGDEVEYKGETMRVYLATFNADGWALWCSREGIDGRLSGSFGERVKRPTPKVLDADGVPINVGDTVWCEGNEGPFTVDYVHVTGYRCVTIKSTNGMCITVDPERLTHKRPDSWERLEKDAYHLVMSEYIETPEKDVSDLVRRAKALAKAGETE